MSTALLKIAAVYVALHTLLLIGLAVFVVRARYRAGVGLGDGGDKNLLAVSRIHGNAAEQAAPTFALLLLLAALSAPAWTIHLFGIATLVGRVFHAAGLRASAGPTLGRRIGMMLTWTSFIVASGALLVLALS